MKAITLHTPTKRLFTIGFMAGFGAHSFIHEPAGIFDIDISFEADADLENLHKDLCAVGSDMWNAIERVKDEQTKKASFHTAQSQFPF